MKMGYSKNGKNCRTALCVACCLLLSNMSAYAQDVERWGMFELAMEGPSGGNPFKDVQVNADRWGYQSMDDATDDFYLRYVMARLSAYRNVWWSLANEYDFMRDKQKEDWDRFFQIIVKHDPYGHLRGIHNGRDWYDHTKPWVTHASLQTSNFQSAQEYRQRYQKPIIYDECRYEGNIPMGWGNISAEEMTHHFWAGTLAGCYVGHGETYGHPKDLLWWSKGGVLRGESPKRISVSIRTDRGRLAFFGNETELRFVAWQSCHGQGRGILSDLLREHAYPDGEPAGRHTLQSGRHRPLADDGHPNRYRLARRILVFRSKSQLRVTPNTLRPRRKTAARDRTARQCHGRPPRR